MITSAMVQKHMQKALSEGGIQAQDVKIQYLPERETAYREIKELSYENPENGAFYSAAYVLMDSVSRQATIHDKRRIGGFNLYPVGYNAQKVNFRPRVFSGQYRMGFCNFELSTSMLNEAAATKLAQVYQLIREDVEREIEYNSEDSTLVLHRTSWEPPHFHVQDQERAKEIDSISYAVKISGTGPHTSVFDFFSDSFLVSTGDHNPITKIYFKGKYIHQVFKTAASDDNMYFFFVWDGCKLKKNLDLEKSVYVERWLHRGI